MSMFRRHRHEMPGLNMSSMPDLIFTVLFFFMIVTTMREVTLKVKFTTPQGTELEKLGKKSTVSFIYIGPPTDALRAQMGSGTRIQLNDRYAEAREVMDFVAQERQALQVVAYLFVNHDLTIGADGDHAAVVLGQIGQCHERTAVAAP